MEGAFERVQLAERLAFALLGVVEMVALASYLAEALLSFFGSKREKVLFALETFWEQGGGRKS